MIRQTEQLGHIHAVALIALATAIRCWMGSVLSLGDDEAFYWLWAQHPATCYFDHPGMVAWLVGLSTSLFGDTLLAVRLPTILLSAASAGAIYLVARRLFNATVGFWSAVLFTLIPLFALGGVLVASDAPMGFFWLLYVACVSEAVVFERRGFWYPAGIALGLALVSKYVSVLLLPSTLLFLLSFRTGRAELRRKEPYIAMGMAILVFLPVLMWNASNSWLSLLFNLTGRHGAGHFRPTGFPEFLATQLLALSPLVLIALFVTLTRVWRLSHHNTRFRLLFWFSVVTLALFWGGSFLARMKPHWPAPGYLTLIIATSALWMGVGGRRAKKSWIAACLLVALVFTTLLHTQAFVRFIPLSPRDDNTNHLYGWDLVTPVVEAKLSEMGGETAVVFADRYQIAAQLAWNLKRPRRTFSLDPQRDQFDFWIEPEEIIGSSGVFVWEEHWELKEGVISAFESAREVAQVPVYRQGKEVRRFHVVECRNLRRFP